MCLVFRCPTTYQRIIKIGEGHLRYLPCQCSAASSWRQARTKIFRITDEGDIAHVVSELPTARKPWLYLDTAYFESYATDVFITPCLSPCSVEARRKSCGTYQRCYKFWLWIFFFCNLFFQHFFFQLFFKIFS